LRRKDEIANAFFLTVLKNDTKFYYEAIEKKKDDLFVIDSKKYYSFLTDHDRLI